MNDNCVLFFGGTMGLLNPEHYLQPGMHCELVVTLPEGDQLIMKSIIEKSVRDGVFRVAAPYYKGKLFLFHDVQTLDVTMHATLDGHQGLIGFPCVIINKSREKKLSYIDLQMLGEITPVQRRNAFRLNYLTDMVYRYHQEEHTLMTKDISATGMYAYTAIKLREGDKVTLIWELPDNDVVEVFEFDALILSSEYIQQERRYAVRMVFDKMPEKYKTKIAGFLLRKQAELIQSDPAMYQKIQEFFDQEPAANTLPPIPLLQVTFYVSWGIMFLSILSLMLSLPDKSYVLDAFFDSSRPRYWVHMYFHMAQWGSVLALLTASAGLMIQVVHWKREEYRFRVGSFFVIFFALLLMILIILLTEQNQLGWFL